MPRIAFAAKLGLCAEPLAHAGIPPLAASLLVGHTFLFCVPRGLFFQFSVSTSPRCAPRCILGRRRPSSDGCSQLSAHAPEQDLPHFEVNRVKDGTFNVLEARLRVSWPVPSNLESREQVYLGDGLPSRVHVNSWRTGASSLQGRLVQRWKNGVLPPVTWRGGAEGRQRSCGHVRNEAHHPALCLVANGLQVLDLVIDGITERGCH